MKTKVLILFIGLSMISCSDYDNDLVVTKTSEINTSISASRNYSVSIDGGLDAWSKRGNCVRGSGNCAFAIVEENNFNVDTFPVTFKLTGEDEITLDYKVSSKGEDEDNILTFNIDISVPAAICAELGVSSITVLAGNYPIDYSSNANGTVTLTAAID